MTTISTSIPYNGYTIDSGWRFVEGLKEPGDTNSSYNLWYNSKDPSQNFPVSLNDTALYDQLTKLLVNSGTIPWRQIQNGALQGNIADVSSTVLNDPNTIRQKELDQKAAELSAINATGGSSAAQTADQTANSTTGISAPYVAPKTVLASADNGGLPNLGVDPAGTDYAYGQAVPAGMVSMDGRLVTQAEYDAAHPQAPAYNQSNPQQALADFQSGKISAAQYNQWAASYASGGQTGATTSGGGQTGTTSGGSTPTDTSQPQVNGNTVTYNGNTYTTSNPDEAAFLQNAILPFLDQMKQQGLQINPELNLGPDIIAKILEKAKATVHPQYAQQIAVVQQDLLRNSNSTKDEYGNKIASAESNFKNTLGNARENYADSGLAFSGQRGQGELNLAGEQDRNLSSLSSQYGQNLGNYARNAEEQLGTDGYNSSGFKLPSLGNYQANLSGNGGFSQNGTVNTGYTPGTYGIGKIPTAEEEAALALRNANVQEASSRKSAGLSYTDLYA